MQTKRLGNTDMDISRVGFGAWAIGGKDWKFGWGPQDDSESIAAIRRGIELGINWIDTAAVYGFGRSEQVVAAAVSELPADKKPFLFTKCGLVRGPEPGIPVLQLDPESIRKEVEESIRFLRVEVIDLYQIHWPALLGEPENMDAIKAAWQCLAELKDAGKVRHIGVSNFDARQLEAIRPIHQVSSLQPPYSLLAREVENETLTYCEENNIGVINYSPMKSGLLTGAMTRGRIKNLPEGDWRRESSEFQEPKLTANLDLVDCLRRVATRHSTNPGSIAIAWTLANTAITGAIVGARRPSQIEGTVGASDLTLTEADLSEIEAAIP